MLSYFEHLPDRKVVDFPRWTRVKKLSGRFVAFKYRLIENLNLQGDTQFRIIEQRDMTSPHVEADILSHAQNI